MKRKLSIPLCGFKFAQNFQYSSESGTSRSPAQSVPTRRPDHVRDDSYSAVPGKQN